MPRWFAISLCAFGALLLVAGLRQSSRARETRGWTRTTGKILESRVDRVDTSGDEDRPERFRLVIRYSFEARGVRRQSSQVWMGSPAAAVSEHPRAAGEWVERFPAGAEVPVWFDPANPDQAVLVHDVPRAHLTALYVIGGILAAVGFIALARGGSR